MEKSKGGRPPLDKDKRRDKIITVALTSAQYNSLSELGETVGEPRISYLLYKLVDKALQANSEAIQKHKECKSCLKW